jgi:3-oxoacyl-[acyl-carrier protein] reductase
MLSPYERRCHRRTAVDYRTSTLIAALTQGVVTISMLTEGSKTMTSLEGRVAIVTGGARGIGRAYCLGLAAEGCTVAVADLGDPTPVVDEVRALGTEAIGVHVDVSDDAKTRAMAAEVVDAYGRIDILVNNAGYMTTSQQLPFEEFSIEEFDKPWAINVRGSWLCARAVVPTMKKQGHGKIVNVGSTTVVDGTPTMLPYLSSKAAIIGLTRGMARELGEYNIAVNMVTPDYIPHDKDFASRQPEHQSEWIASRRCFVRDEVPEDMVGVVVFLSGSGSDFITGQDFHVNGGSHFH